MIGHRIRVLREHKSYSQTGLAETVGIHRTYLSEVERDIANPTLELLARIAEACDASLEDIFCTSREYVRYKNPEHQKLHNALQKYIERGRREQTAAETIIFSLERA